MKTDEEIFREWYTKGMPDTARLLPLEELNEHQVKLFMMYREFKWHLLRVRYGELWQRFKNIFS